MIACAKRMMVDTTKLMIISKHHEQTIHEYIYIYIYTQMHIIADVTQVMIETKKLILISESNETDNTSSPAPV